MPLPPPIPQLSFLWGDLYNAETHKEWQNKPVRYANVLLRAACVRSPKLWALGTQKGILEVHNSWHIWSCHGRWEKKRKYLIWLEKESKPGSPCCKPCCCWRSQGLLQRSDCAAVWVYGIYHIPYTRSASASLWLFSVFLRRSLFNHDLYKRQGKPTFSVVAAVEHSEPFTGVRFYFKWSVDPSQLSQPICKYLPFLSQKHKDGSESTSYIVPESAAYVLLLSASRFYHKLGSFGFIICQIIHFVGN